MELFHHQFPDYVQKPGAPVAVYLIHGEPVLVEQCVEPLIQRLLNGALRQIQCEVLDGAMENIPDALERMNTFGWSAGPRIVWFKEARLFDTGGSQQQQRLIDQIREALESDQPERAARIFANLCSRLGVDASSAAAAKNPEFKPLISAVGEDAVTQLSSYCSQHGFAAAGADDYLPALEQAIEKGFPPQHYLLISASVKFPKNRKLYKAIHSHGLIVDCNVPLGERKADKAAQETVLRQILDGALKKTGKRMPPALFATMIQLTGFDPATFRDNVEKLIDYTGTRNEITASDVQNVVKRTKNDPLFELTNAVADRNRINALFYLHTLLNSGWHPLQILAALSNQIRKLLLAKDFTSSDQGRRCWRAGISYPQFQSEVLPALQAFDARLSQQVHQWGAHGGEPAARKEGADLALATNPGNAYPIYQTLLKSEKYPLGELVQAMTELNQTDMRLKSTGQDPALQMKRLVMKIVGVS
jgi:DNA polymerase III subunit delta